MPGDDGEIELEDVSSNENSSGSKDKFEILMVTEKSVLQITFHTVLNLQTRL
ncbi:MAG: hypothetical protein CM15mP42_11330 [Methanobacteriota archaeon]|nr:MAG: hypothetical protein CM15mP42_11330 [Euryarchaeota archaeon]